MSRKYQVLSNDQASDLSSSLNDMEKALANDDDDEASLLDTNKPNNKELYYVPPSKQLNQSQQLLRTSQSSPYTSQGSPYATSTTSPKLVSTPTQQQQQQQQQQQHHTGPSQLSLASDIASTSPSLKPVDVDDVVTSAAQLNNVNSGGHNTPTMIANNGDDDVPLNYAIAADNGPDRSPQSFRQEGRSSEEDDTFMRTIKQIRHFKFQKKHKKKFIHYLLGMLPIISWLPKYSIKEDLRGDIVAGLTVGVMLIPQGMAYALVADLPMVYGLYSSIVPIFAYCVFGTSRHLSFGPFAIISLLVLETVNGVVGDSQDMELRTSIAILLAFVCGLYQIILGLFRFGFVANFLSDPVKTGFVSGCALIIGSSQFKHIFGYKVEASDCLPVLLVRYLIKIKEANWWSILIAVAGIVFLLGMKKFNQRFNLKLPGPLIIVMILTFISWVFKLEERTGIDVVGPIPSGLPIPTFPTIPARDGRDNNWLHMVINITPGALVLILVGFISSVSIGATIAEKYNYDIDPNQELIALGASDFIGSFFLSFPVGASLSRTAVNASSGARTQVASFITALVIVSSLFFLTHIIKFLPKSILASIVIVAVIDLVEYKIAIRLWKVHRMDLMLYLISFGSTILLGILQGILIGMVCSLLLIIYRSAYPPFAELGRIPGTELYKNIKRVPEAETFMGIKVVRIDGSIYFANTQFIRKKLRRYEPTKKRTNESQMSDSETEMADISDDLVTVDIDGHPIKGAIIIDCSSMNDIDSTGLKMLKELVAEFTKRSLVIYFASIKGYVRDLLKKGGVVETYGADHFFWTVNDAVEHHLYLIRQRRMQLNIQSPPGGLQSPPSPNSESMFDTDKNAIPLKTFTLNKE
ncbi:hypothetical protein SAMD00019534_086920 [Acytostelium subglobosum LB1]|uniref:hypothetical protein n=1 Tax=Acytostelium subglobosum LB1 TaxID=1410327 RepID=UPI00064522B8|nr:hypothetical protein SAMD00019534_086920 [Acytostelium subglobosum LB1]GAM25517.1 hypothetical protein SAMD00019534_086920 [Acytostelium subglobosum LB1]|eukprot:XP_012751503.1 hypothetical protein SAMD00019534_086920 [Acytostelium subglobosum LB1]